MDTFGKGQGFPHPADGVLNLVEADKRGSAASQWHAPFPNHFRAGIARLDQFVHARRLTHARPCGEVVFQVGHGFTAPAEILQPPRPPATIPLTAVTRIVAPSFQFERNIPHKEGRNRFAPADAPSMKSAKLFPRSPHPPRQFR
jgi:hypothetical protein